MRRFSRIEFERFLRLIDAELSKECSIVVIGGAAVGLAYHGAHATADLDLWGRAEDAFWRAVEAANTKLPQPIPVQPAPIAQPPHEFEDRLVELRLRGLTQLHVWIPERHDLAILKAGRADAHDLDAIEEIHRVQPLKLKTLVERYYETKDHVIGPPSRFKLSFLAMVARLFGEECALDLESTLDR